MVNYDNTGKELSIERNFFKTVLSLLSMVYCDTVLPAYLFLSAPDFECFFSFFSRQLFADPMHLFCYCQPVDPSSFAPPAEALVVASSSSWVAGYLPRPLGQILRLLPSYRPDRDLLLLPRLCPPRPPPQGPPPQVPPLRYFRSVMLLIVCSRNTVILISGWYRGQCQEEL